MVQNAVEIANWHSLHTFGQLYLFVIRDEDRAIMQRCGRDVDCIWQLVSNMSPDTSGFDQNAPINRDNRKCLVANEKLLIDINGNRQLHLDWPNMHLSKSQVTRNER